MANEYKLLINGNWVESKNIRIIKFPFDGREVGKVHFAESEQMEKAINSAHSAFSKTKKLSSHERSIILEKIANQIRNRRQELAESITLQSGKVIRHSLVEVDRAINTFQIASEEAKRIGGEIIPLDLSPQTKGRVGLIRRFPIGVIAGITPFNFPLNLVAHKVAPAIACGNTIVLKPSSQVPITSILLGEIVKETDYPPGGFNVVPSGYKEAEVLLTDEKVKKLTFTGSPAVGWELKKKAHRKKVTLELGGNAALIVEPDANLEYAVKRAVFGAFSFSGQICISIQRIFLHNKIYDKFMDDFISQTKKLKMGNPLNEDTDIGPMINLNAAKKTEEWIQEAVDNGARIVIGGKREGVMFEPTILENVKPELRISWLEAFAPIVVIYSYKDFEEALNGVNYSIYGLQAGIFTSDLKKIFRAYEELDVGGVIINDVPTFRIDHMPYGGVKESGFGREGLKYAIEEMTELKLLAINLEV
ncbi:aldehyde dehydrogenase family protein [Candidatus Aminicenantes bacterium AH-873-B07]|nr:aldehyde dehydrogenase family protein [Candidatus Aminicenantes bacterium AH-873-B07]